MAGSVNSVTLVGNLGKDPEFRTLNNGDSVCNLSVATSDSWKNRDGERQTRTEWNRVTVWGNGLVDAIGQYLHKGSKVMIHNAKLQTRKWQDQSGNDRYSTDIVVQGFGSQVIFLDSRSDNAGEPQRQQQSGGTHSAYQGDKDPVPFDDDVPF